MKFKKIHLDLAPTESFPEGSRNHGYEFVAPLDEDGNLDVEEWRRHRRKCTVFRFWQGEDDEHGYLVHTGDETWMFSYVPGEADGEPIFHFNAHPFREGESVPITEQDGETYPFRVVSVR